MNSADQTVPEIGCRTCVNQCMTVFN